LSTAFFSVANAGHFLGAAALLNSLRDAGHDEPFYLVDCGLTARQRAAFAGHATLIQAPPGISPFLLKALGPLEVDPDVAVILDADVIVRRRLTHLIGPKPVVFLNDLTTRFEPEWARFGYGRLRRIPYLNSGQMIFPRSSGLLPRLQEGNKRMIEILRAEPNKCLVPTDPFYYTDQDVLNALMASLDDDEYVVSDQVAYWPFTKPLGDVPLLHHIMDKPWLKQLRPNAYSCEMVRLLGAGPVLPPRDDIPRRLRPGAAGLTARAVASTRHEVRNRTRGKLGIRARRQPTLPPWLSPPAEDG
jgi:hypothetical protein